MKNSKNRNHAYLAPALECVGARECVAGPVAEGVGHGRVVELQLQLGSEPLSDDRHRKADRQRKRKPERGVPAAVLERRTGTRGNETPRFCRKTKVEHAANDRYPSTQARGVARERD